VKRLRRRGKLTPEILDLLIEELDDVFGNIPSSYYKYETDDDDDNGDDDDGIEGKIDSEEIEVALSGIISTISKRCKLKVEPTSLSALLEILFSPDDDLVSLASNIEESINGYFGELFGENLDLANDYFSDLLEELKERREKWNQLNG
jgi:hypothetical protein